MALRWSDIDFQGATLRVYRSLQQTRAGLAFKSPKTAAGRRKMGLRSVAVEALRDHRRAALKLCLALSLGRMSVGSPVFGNPDGSPRSPHSVSNAWSRAVKRLGLPKVTFHALRHSHASALIAGGLDVVSVSKRLGHGSPAVTLSVYSHLFTNTDEEAVAVIDDVFGAK